MFFILLYFWHSLGDGGQSFFFFSKPLGITGATETNEATNYEIIVGRVSRSQSTAVYRDGNRAILAAMMYDRPKVDSCVLYLLIFFQKGIVESRGMSCSIVQCLDIGAC